MKSCTIIISHFESLPFLRACIHQIRKYKHPEIKQHIIISDQSFRKYHSNVVYEFGNSEDITIVWMKPLYSGYGIDFIIRHIGINTDYICQLHVDAFPIHINWLKFSIGLCEQNNFTFAGVRQFLCEKPEPIYPFKNPFFAMAQSFHVGKTDVYKEMSLYGGFTRFHNRPPTGMEWLNSDWYEWAKEDYDARGSDDDVPAFYWQDTYREDNKFGMGITGLIGIKGEESGYGSIIEDMVFHFGFCRESIGVMPQMGEKYSTFTKRINEGFTDELIEEMLIKARQQPLDPKQMRYIWDGKLKKQTLANEEFNIELEKLKL